MANCNVVDKETVNFLIKKGLNPFHRKAKKLNFDEYIELSEQVTNAIEKVELSNGIKQSYVNAGTNKIPVKGVTRNTSKRYIEDPHLNPILSTDELYLKHKKIVAGTATGELLNDTISVIKDLIITDDELNEELLYDLIKIFHYNRKQFDSLDFYLSNKGEQHPDMVRIKNTFKDFINEKTTELKSQSIFNNKNELQNTVYFEFKESVIISTITNALLLLNKAIKDLKTINGNNPLTKVLIEFEKDVVIHETSEIGKIDLAITGYSEEMGLKSIIFDHKTKIIDNVREISAFGNASMVSYNKQLQKYAVGLNNMGSETIAAYISPLNVITTDDPLIKNGSYTITDIFHENSFFTENALERLNLKAAPFSKTVDDSLNSLTEDMSKYIQTLTGTVSSNRVNSGNRSQISVKALEKRLVNAERQLTHMKRKNLTQFNNSYNLLISFFDISGFLNILDDFKELQTQYFSLYEEISRDINDFKRNNPNANEIDILENFIDFISLLAEYKNILINQSKILAPLKNHPVTSSTLGETDIFLKYQGSLKNHFNNIDSTDYFGIDSALDLIKNVIHNPDFMDNHRELYEELNANINNKKEPKDFINTTVNNQTFFSVFYKIFSKKAANVTEDASYIEDSLSDLIIELMPKSYLSSKSNIKTIVAQSPNFNEIYFTRAEQINNPVIELLVNLKERPHQIAREQYSIRVASFNKILNAYNKYKKENNITDDSIILNSELGLLHPKLNEEFKMHYTKAKSDKNETWFRSVYEFKDEDAKNTWFQNYSIEREYFKESREDFFNVEKIRNDLNIARLDRDYKLKELDRKIYDKKIAGEPLTKSEIDNNKKLIINAYEDIESRLNTKKNDMEIEINKDLINFDLEFDLLSSSIHSKAFQRSNNLKYLKLKDSVVEQYASEQYKKISSIPAVLDMYNEFVSFATEAKEVMGGNRAIIPDNFFPSFQKGLKEAISNSGQLFDFVGEISDIIMRELRVQPIDTELGVQSDNGIYNKSIPFMGIQPLIHTSSNIYAKDNEELLKENAKQQTRDLGFVGKAFLSSMYINQQLRYTEPLANAVLHFAKSNRYLEQESRNSKLVTTLFGDASYSPDSSIKKAPDLVEKYLNYFWYGIQYTDIKTNKTSNRILLSNKEKGDITVQSLLSFVKKTYSLNVLSFAYISGSAAGLAGVIQTWINSSEGIYYDAKTLRKAYDKFLRNIGDSKTRGQMRRLSFEFESGSTSYFQYDSMQEKEGLNKINDWLLYGALRHPDMMISDVITEAVLNFYGLDANGNVIRLNKLPENERVPLIDLISIDEEGLIVYDSKIAHKQISQIRKLVSKASTETYGQLPDTTKMGIQMHFITNLFMTFKSWLPALFLKRFHSGDYDPVTRIVNIGRYTAAGSMLYDRASLQEGIKGILSMVGENAWFLISGSIFRGNHVNESILKAKFAYWVDKNPQAFKRMEATYDEGYEMFKEGFEASIRSATLELYILTTLLMTLTALRGDYDDDGEEDYKKYRVSRIFIRVLSKTNVELLTLLNPNSYQRLLSEPLPIAGALKDLLKVITNGGDEILDFLTGDEDKRDKTPFLYHGSNYVFGFRQFRRIFEPFENDKNFEIRD